MNILALLVLAVMAGWLPQVAAQSAAPALPPAVATPGAPPTDAPSQPTQRDDRETIEASTKWLALLDAGKTGAAWDSGSPYLKSVVTRTKWIDGITDARKPFGKFVKRTPTKFARSHSMPGAPEGDYSIIEFDTEFENGKRAQEQIIWMLGEREVWSVSGYFIR
jgi:Protein of unknown function (DUF4019)